MEERGTSTCVLSPQGTSSSSLFFHISSSLCLIELKDGKDDDSQIPIKYTFHFLEEIISKYFPNFMFPVFDYVEG